MFERTSQATTEAVTAPARMAEAAAAVSERDYETALGIWVGIAQAGESRAQAEIGRCFVNGWGVPRDVDLAAKWLTLAAKAGDPLGQRLLGDFHFNGLLGKPDASLTRLGLLYNNARGVERDAAAAAKWWRMAAEHDDADGQAMLGAAYHLGAGVERDQVTALAWLTRARAARCTFADRFYKAVRESCTPEQRREAERRAGLPLAGLEAAS
jgi:uncharacterized protein